MAFLNGGDWSNLTVADFGFAMRELMHAINDREEILGIADDDRTLWQVKDGTDKAKPAEDDLLPIPFRTDTTGDDEEWDWLRVNMERMQIAVQHIVNRTNPNQEQFNERYFLVGPTTREHYTTLSTIGGQRKNIFENASGYGSTFVDITPFEAQPRVGDWILAFHQLKALLDLLIYISQPMKMEPPSGHRMTDYADHEVAALDDWGVDATGDAAYDYAVDNSAVPGSPPADIVMVDDTEITVSPFPDYANLLSPQFGGTFVGMNYGYLGYGSAPFIPNPSPPPATISKTWFCGVWLSDDAAGDFVCSWYGPNDGSGDRTGDGSASGEQPPVGIMTGPPYMRWQKIVDRRRGPTGQFLDQNLEIDVEYTLEGEVVATEISEEILATETSSDINETTWAQMPTTFLNETQTSIDITHTHNIPETTRFLVDQVGVGISNVHGGQVTFRWGPPDSDDYAHNAIFDIRTALTFG